MRKRDKTKKFIRTITGHEQRSLLKIAERYRDIEYPNETIMFVLGKIKNDAVK
jgi:hypothetical protein